MSLKSFYDWFMQQIEYIILIVFIVLLIGTAYKRAWIAMVGVIIGIGFIAIFIFFPDTLKTIATWVKDMVTK
ncbi:TcpD family membrane protein [Lysinibacillus sp. 1P01SD]|uniref:TcpD family membrane protein n=1 Tax=Lysinibacillus sp. 1P01SD TaxID=3132285 RepID=UPI0039A1E294